MRTTLLRALAMFVPAVWIAGLPQPAAQLFKMSSLDHARQKVADQAGGVGKIPGQEGIIAGFFQSLLFFVPLAGSPIQFRE